MRLAILSDVHGNAEALRAVIRDAECRMVDEFACLGDVVGYGADPDVCLDELVDRCSILVAGNHDLAAVGVVDARRFNPLARTAVEYSRSRLGPERLAILEGLPLEQQYLGAHFVHASPIDPHRFPYIRDSRDAAEIFQAWRGTGPVFFGHTHVAVSFLDTGAASPEVRFGPGVRVSKRSRVLCDVGSVGQPRDHDPRASYGILDTREGQFTRYRVSYDVEAAAEKIRAASLPDALGQRLLVGV